MARYRVFNDISTNVLNNKNLYNQLLFDNDNDNGNSGFDFVFLDQEKSYYLKDTLLLETNGLLSPLRCRIIADNVIFPGAPDYLNYMNANIDSNTITDSKWRTIIKPLPFERIGFETEFKEKGDGMSISSYDYR